MFIEAASNKIDIPDLWEKYKNTKSIELRNRIFEYYYPHVIMTAKQIRKNSPVHIELEDMINYGVIGLLDAISKYDYSKEVTFFAYARIRVRGEIFDGIRQERLIPYYFIKKKIEEEHKEHKEAKVEKSYLDSIKIKQKKHINNYKTNSYSEYKEIKNKKIISMINTIFLTDLYYPKYENPYTIFEMKETEKEIVQKIMTMKPKQKKAFILYVYEKLTVGKIAGVLGLSRSRVSMLIFEASKNISLNILDLKEASAIPDCNEII